jgi:CxC2 like cysteine cluster associated with KDZ transposases
MRQTHWQSPLHRIEQWTGSHFRPAELWEVGTYILVRHHGADTVCDRLSFERNYLETFQLQKDEVEQVNFRGAPAPAPAPTCNSPGSEDVEMDSPDQECAEPQINTNDATDDEDFLRYLDRLRQTQGDDTESIHDSGSVDDELDNDEQVQDSDEGMASIEPYLPSSSSAGGNTDRADAGWLGSTGRAPSVPQSDALNNTYVRIVHTNGIHHLALVSCPCQGQEMLPLDLVACRLVPASLVHIRTLFSTQVLDYFRLCNLELKASAYQFYQLIRRLTMAVAPASVINLYHELRRMSRLWRWMKKLKWAGYGHNKQDPQNPPPGALVNFCPACPQPGVNLPDNWKDDANRQAHNFRDFHVVLTLFQVCFPEILRS